MGRLLIHISHIPTGGLSEKDRTARDRVWDIESIVLFMNQRKSDRSSIFLGVSRSMDLYYWNLEFVAW